VTTHGSRRRSPGEAVDVIDLLAGELLGRPGVQQILDRAVALAEEGIPGAGSSSIALLDGRRRVSTVAASGDLARAGDDLQYRLGEGPCLDAVGTSAAVHAADLDAEDRWTRWRAQAARDLGVRSMLSVRLATRERTLGTLNLYGREPNAFPVAAVTLAGSYATHVSLNYARARERQDLETALASRTVIGQAQGILMERHRITADRAFAVLSAASQESNVRLVEVARRLVDTGEDPRQRRR
jgi:hypothetical protein